MTGGTPTQVDGDPEMMRGIPTKTDETKGPQKDGKAQEDERPKDDGRSKDDGRPKDDERVKRVGSQKIRSTGELKWTLSGFFRLECGFSAQRLRQRLR